MKLFGITGCPLEHSLSPLLHNWALRRAGIAGAYLAWPLESGRMAEMVNAARVLRIQGISVTIPHKEAIMPLLDGLSERARAAGAVNTLHWLEGALCGTNTDVEGFIAPLRGRVFSGALVMGAGGAARAVLAGLRELNMPAAICNRHGQRARRLAEEFGVRFVDWADRDACEANLIINATPLGMHGAFEGQCPLPPQAFMRQGTNRLAYDLVYTPLITPFLSAAKAAGWQTLDGLAMFIAQAQAQFRLWTGREFSERGARELLLKALLRRAAKNPPA